MTYNKKLERKIIEKIICADFWAGAGGTSTGLSEAVKEMGFDLELTAVNHWEVAVATHSKNYPNARHFCKAVDSLSPLELFPNRRIKLLVCSPECTHHSRARGGKPRDEQRRADAWDIARWTEKLFIENLIIENVEEFTTWSPLDGKGQPIKSKKGLLFKQFIDYLKLTYTVEWRILNCADYGDATTRKRFFLLAKRGKNKRIVFPAPTHASRKALAVGQQDLFNQTALKPWVAAREIINWNLEGRNVFGRKKELSANTMKRIYAGLRKYSGIDIPERQFSDDAAEQRELDAAYRSAPIKIDFSKFNAFTMGTGGPTGQMQPRSAEEPVRAILTDPRQNVFAPRVEPFLFNQKASDRRMRAIDEPAFTQTANSQHQYLVEPYMYYLARAEQQQQPTNERAAAHGGAAGAATGDATTDAPRDFRGAPFFVSYHGGQADGGVNRSHAVNAPVPTLDTSNRFGLVQPFVVPCNHGKNDARAHDLDEPFLVRYFGGMTAVSVDEPVPTITANYEHYALVTPFAVKFNGGEDGKDLNEPAPTVTTKDRLGLGQPFLIQFFGERAGQNPRTRDVDSPFWTVTPQIRQGIVEPFLVKLEDARGKVIDGLLLLELGAILVINFRMLHQSELAAAMSFPPDYYFHGTRDQQVKQIGNAVPCRTAKALCRAMLEGGGKKRAGKS